MPESNLHRMIVKMLIMSILEEQFVSVRIKGGSSNISVYMGLGKKHANLLQNKISIVLSDGDKQNQNKSFKKANPPDLLDHTHLNDI